MRITFTCLILAIIGRLALDLAPLVRKLKDGKYEITFESEIAKGLP